MSIYLNNQRPLQLSPKWGKFFLFFLGLFVHLLSAQITISGNAKLSIKENAYIYTQQEISGKYDALAVYVDSSVLLVAKSDPSPAQNATKKSKPKQNSLKSSQKNIAKTKKVQPKKTVQKIMSRTGQESMLSSRSEQPIAVVNSYNRGMAVVFQIFFVEKFINDIVATVFERDTFSENNFYRTTPKTRPPPGPFIS